MQSSIFLRDKLLNELQLYPSLDTSENTGDLHRALRCSYQG